MSNVVLDDHEQAGRIAVKPMDDARTVLTAECRERVKMKLERVDQGASPVALGGVSHHAGGLVNHGQSVVFVEDLDRDVLGFGGRVRQLGQPHAYDIPGADPIGRLDGPPVDEDRVGVDDLLDHAPGVVGVTTREVRVDPLAVRPGLDVEFLRCFRERRRPHDRGE